MTTDFEIINAFKRDTIFNFKVMKGKKSNVLNTLNILNDSSKPSNCKYFYKT